MWGASSGLKHPAKGQSHTGRKPIISKLGLYGMVLSPRIVWTRKRPEHAYPCNWGCQLRMGSHFSSILAGSKNRQTDASLNFCRRFRAHTNYQLKTGRSSPSRTSKIASMWGARPTFVGPGRVVQTRFKSVQRLTFPANSRVESTLCDSAP